METSDEKKVRLDGNWLSMADAAKRTPYSAEYLSLLARKGKLGAKKIDNVWYTTKDLLQSYMDRQMMRVEIQNGTISPRGGSADEPLRKVRTFESDVAEIMAAKGRFEQQATFANDSAVLDRRFDKDMSEPAPHPISPEQTAVEASIPSISPSESIVPLASEMKRISSSIEHISKKIESISLPQASTHEPLERLYEKFDQFVDRKIESKQGVVSKMHGSVLESFVTVARRKHLLMIVIVLLGILAVFPIPFVNALFERSFGLVKDLWGDANTVMGFRPGTHANEILLLDKEGNISLYGHVETEGQLRSFIEDGIAPIVVESSTLVDNLNAEYLDGLQGKDFTLAFVTKNGNITTEDVYLEGKVEVGKTLLVKGASRLLSSLSVDGSLGVLGDATFKKGITVEGPSRFKALVEAQSIDASGVVKGLSLIAEGGVFGAEVFASRTLSTDGNLTVKGQSNFGGFAFFNRGLQASTGDFADALSVGGSFGAAGEVKLGSGGKKDIILSGKNVTLDSTGNLTVGGALTTGATTTSTIAGRLLVNSRVSATFFEATDSSATSTFAGGLAIGGNDFIVDGMTGRVGLGTTTDSGAKLGLWGSGTLLEISDTASTTLFIVSSNGNVGIGTTSPSQKLGVGGDVYVAGTVSADAFVATSSLSGPFFQATDSSATSTFKGDILVKGLAAWSYFTAPSIQATSTTATSTFAGFIDVNGTGTNATSTFASNLWVKGTLQTGTGSIYLTDTSITAGSGAFKLNTSATSTFATNGFTIGTNQFVVQQTSGNVGIGTTTPAQKLSVQGNLYTSGTSFFGGAITATSSSITFSGLGTNMLTSINNSGNLVATSTPTAAYYLATSSIASVFPYASTTAFSSSGGAWLATSGGNVGIGTTSPYGLLAIEQGAETNSLWIGNTGSSTPSFVVLGANGNGRVGIGTSSPYRLLSVVGDAVINSMTVGQGGGSVQTNTVLGNMALQSNTTGYQNTALGYEALRTSSTGSSTVAIGHQALRNATWSENNVVIGNQALFSADQPWDNVALGYQSMYSGTNPANNIALGSWSAYSITTGQSNIAIGRDALRGITSGNYNVAIGDSAAYSTKGEYNIAIGADALWNNGTGQQNVVFGYRALYENMSATSSVAIGYQAGYGVAGTANQNNVFLGYQSGLGISTGSNNVLVGYRSGDALTTGSNNIILGYDIDVPSNAGSNQLSIGNLIFGTGVNGTGTTISSGNIGVGTSTPSSRFSVQGNTLISGNLSVAGITATSTLNVTGLTTLASGFISQASSTVASTLRVSDGFFASSSLQATGATRLFSTFTADGAATLSSTLGVTNLATLSGGFLSLASSTLQNFTAVNSTSTSATSTNFFATNLQATNLVFTNQIVTNSTTTNATTTNLAVTSLTSGRIPYASTGGNLIDNAALTFDGTKLVATYASTTAISSTGGAWFATSGGNVGIGTTTPTGILSIQAGDPDVIINSTTAGKADIRFRSDGATKGVIGMSGAPEGDNSTDLMMFAETGGGLRFYTNGSATEAAVITSAGNVGIGTTSPGAKLEVVATGRTLQLDATGANPIHQIFQYDGVDKAYIGVSGDGNDIFTGDVAGDFGIRSESNLIFGSNGNNIRMYIASGGNVGIGTTNPGAKLQVSLASLGAVPSLGTHAGQFSVVGDSSGYGLNVGVLTNGNVFQQVGRTDATATAYNLLLQPNGGNVGIGTASPDYILDIEQAAADIALTSTTGTNRVLSRFVNTGGTGFVSLNGSSAGGVFGTNGLAYAMSLGGAGTNPVQFGTNNTAYVTIINGGNVGIGDTTPSYKLEVTGSTNLGSGTASTTIHGLDAAVVGFGTYQLQVRGNTNTQLVVGASNDQGVSWLQSQFNDAAARSLLLNPLGGNVGIGTTSPGALFAIGNAATSGGVYVTSSGYIGVGTKTPQTPLHVITSDGELTVTSGRTFEMVSSSAAGSNNPVNFNAYRSRSGGAVANDDNLFSLTAYGHDGADADVEAGGIHFVTDGTVTTGIIPTEILFKTAGGGAGMASKMVIKPNGNVGIGTTTPAARLGVAGDILADNITGTRFIATSTTATSTFAGFIDVNGTGTNATSTFASNLWVKGALQVGTGSTYINTNSIAFSAAGAITTGTGALSVTPAAGSNFNVNLSTTGDFAVNTSQLYVDTSAGFVGIGTASPVYKLDVAGTTAFAGAGTANNGFYTILGTYANARALIEVKHDTTTNTADGLDIAKWGGTQLARFATSNSYILGGNVGIGTTGPDAKLDVESTSGEFLRLTNTTNGDTWRFHSDSSPGLSIAGGGTKMFSIDRSTGNVGISSTSPHARFAVDGGGGTYITSGGLVGIGTNVFGTGDKLKVAATSETTLFAHIDGSTSSSDGNASVKLTKKATASNANVEFWTTSTQDWVLGTGITATDANFRLYAGTGQAVLTAEKSGAVSNTLYLKAGNVGIGTTAPGGKLEIKQGSEAATQGLWLTRSSEATSMKLYMNSSLGGLSDPLVFSSTLSGDVAAIGRDGKAYFASNVGIGSTSPAALLAVGGNAISSGGFYVNTNGNVGIGTASPGQPLHIKTTGNDVFKIEAPTEADIRFTNSAGDWEVGSNNSGNGTSNNHFYIYEGGNYRLTVNRGTGNVGIGTTAPDQKLYILGTSGSPATSGTTQNGIARIRGSQNANLDIGVLTGGGAWLQSTDVSTLAVNYALLLNPNGGNVGVGTTTPGAKLEVAGASAQLRIHDTDVSNVFWSLGTDNNADFAVWENTATNANNRLMIKSGGNVGIGTTSPQIRSGSASGLNIDGSGDVGVQLNTSLTNGGNVFFTGVSGSTSGDMYVTNKTAQRLFLGTGSHTATHLTINSGGNVGVGDATPAAKLQIGNNVATGGLDNFSEYQLLLYENPTAAASYGLGVKGDTMVFNSDNYYSFDADGSALMVIGANGNVGIGTASPNNGKLEILAASNKSIATYLPSAASGISDFSAGGVGWQFSRPSEGAYAHGIYSYDTASAAKNNLAISSRSDLVFQAGSGGPSSAPERMRITDGGNVGIGTATVDTESALGGTLKLHVAGKIKSKEATDPGFVIENTTSAQRWLMFLDGDLRFYDAVDSRQVMKLKGDGNVVFENGNVGIGTASPATKLDIDGRYKIHTFTNTVNVESSVANISLGSFNVGAPLWIDVNDTGCNGGGSITFYVPAGYNPGVNGIPRVYTFGDAKSYPNMNDKFSFYFKQKDGSNSYLYMQVAAFGACGGSNNHTIITVVRAGGAYVPTDDPGFTGFTAMTKYTATVSTGSGAGSANYVARWSDATTLTTGVLYDNGTNVSIGTANPATKLTVSRASEAAAYQVTINNDGGISNGNFDGIQFTQGVGGGTFLGSLKLPYYSSGKTDLSLNTRYNANALYILGSANGGSPNVGISTAAPLDRFQVTADNAPVGLGEFMGDNLLFNGGAEDGTTGWTSRDFAVDASSGSGTSAANAPHSGAAHFRGSNDGGMNQAVTVIPGGIYTLSARVRVSAINSGDASQGRIVVGTTTTGRELVDQACNPNTYDVTPTLNKWVLCSATFTAPTASDANSTTIYVGFRAEGNTHTTEFDDLALVRGGMVSSYSAISQGMGSSGYTAISGRVGIGTTAAGANLHVADIGTGDDSRPKFKVGTGSQGQNATVDIIAGDGSNAFQVWDDNALTIPRFMVERGGDTGVGTANPDNLLTVHGGTNETAISIEAQDVFAGIGFNRSVREGTIYDSGTGAFQLHLQSGDLEYEVYNSAGSLVKENALVVDGTTGGVGIGTGGVESGNALDVYTSGADPSTQIQIRAERTSYGNIRGTLKTYAAGAATTNYFKMGIDTGNIILDSGGSVDQFILTHAGNVGIGTTDPRSKLVVNTSTASPGSMLEINNRGDTAAGSWSAIRFGLDSASYPNQYGKGGILYESRDGWNRGKIHFAINSTADSSNVALSNALMTVDGTTSNVGIGTTSPAAKLAVYNSSVTGGDSLIVMSAADNSGEYTGIKLQNSNIDNAAIRSFLLDGSSPNSRLGFFVGDNFGNSLTEKLSILANGNVGIGTSNPSERFVVKDAGDSWTDAHFALEDDSSTNKWDFILGSSDNLYIGYNESTKLYLEADGSTDMFGVYGKMLQSRDEWLRINDDDEGADYHTNGIYMDGPGVGMQGRLAVGDSTHTSAPASGLYVVGGAYLAASSGNVGIGTTAPDSKLEVAGTIISGARMKIEGTGAACSGENDDTAGIWYSDAGDCTTVFAGINSSTNGAESWGIWLGNWDWLVDVNGNVTNGGNLTVQGGTGVTLSATNAKLEMGNTARVDGSYGVLQNTGNGTDEWGMLWNAYYDWSTNEYKFQNSNSQGALAFEMREGSGFQWKREAGAATAGAAFSWDSTLMYLQASSGNLGIGTTGPGANLEIAGYGSAGSIDRTKGIRLATGAGMTAWNFNPGGSGSYRNISFYATGWDGSAVVTRDVMTIGDYGGNVGIGTTAPGYTLNVNRDTGAGLWLSRFTNANTGGGDVYLSHADGYGAYIDAGGDASASTYALNVNKGGTSYLYVRGDGNVGIGTTTPSGLFNVQGGIRANNASGGTPTTGTGVEMSYGGGAGNVISYDRDAGAYKQLNIQGTPLVLNGNAGNVGIGTTPSVKLHVSGAHTGGRGIVEIGSSDDALIAMRKGSGYAGLRIQNSSGTDQWFVGENSSSVLTIDRSFGGAVEFSVDTNGNVGIGTGSPAAVLDIQTAAGTFRQKGFTTVVTDRLDASATQARRFEIARAAIDYNDWNSVGSIEIELHEKYWSGGLKKKYVVWYGYVSDAGVYLAEITGKGGNNNFQVTIGAEVVIAGDNRYIPIYVDVDEYAQVIAVIRTNRDLTSANPPGNGAIYVNASPTGSNIADFTADSVVTLNKGYNSYFDSKVGIAVATPQYALDVDVAANTMASIGSNSNTNGNWSGLHIGYREDTNALYRKAGIAFETIGDGAARGKLHLFNDGTNDSSSGSGVSDARLTINYDGNVGIGTTGPGAQLDIVGTTANRFRLERTGFNTTALTFNSSNAMTVSGAAWDFQTGVSIGFSTGSWVPTSGSLYVSGNVGIGTTDPTSAKTVIYTTKNTAALTLAQSDADTTSYVELRLSGDAQVANRYSAIRGVNNVGADVNELAFLTSNVGAPTEKVRINKLGNVGIGTTTPGAKLDIAGSGPILNLLDTGTSYAITQYRASNNTVNDAYFGVAGSTGVGGLITGGGGLTNAAVISRQGAYAIQFGTNNVARMTIDGSGNVGIGTTSPGSSILTEKFTLVGDQVLSDASPSIGFYETDNNQWYSIDGNDSLLKFSSVTSGGTATARMVINNSGNVGIGTTSPAATLAVTGTGYFTSSVGVNVSAPSAIFHGKSASSASVGGMRVDSGSVQTLVAAYGDGAYGYGGTISNNPYHTITNNTIRTTVNTDGNLGVGVLSPSYKLSVSFGLSEGNTLQLNDSDGNCLIDPDAGGLNTTCSSDARLKTNITDAQSQLSYIANIPLREYDVISSGTHLLGVVAQELISSGYEELVTMGENGYYGVRELSSWQLIKGIQEMNQRVSLASAPTTTPSMYIDSSGNIGIGTTSPAYKLHVEGDVAATAFVNISTKAAKKDVAYLDAAQKTSILEKLKNVGVATYNYNFETCTPRSNLEQGSTLETATSTQEITMNGKPVTERKDGSCVARLGLIAEESPAEVLSANGKGVDVYKLAAFILAGVQEQQKNVEALTLRVEDLEKKVAAMTATSTATVTDSSFKSSVIGFVLEHLESLGVKFANGIAYIKTAVIDSVSTKALVIGSENERTGITMYDEVDGKPYCLSVANGATKTTQGACEVKTGSGQTLDTTPPTIEIQGNNPAHIAIGSTYADLGALVSDNVSQNLGYKVRVNGVEVAEVMLDTASTTTYAIEYVATDAAGNAAVATRTVIVGEQQQSTTTTPASSETQPTNQTQSTTTQPSSTSTQTASSSPQAASTEPASSSTTTPAVTTETSAETSSSTQAETASPTPSEGGETTSAAAPASTTGDTQSESTTTTETISAAGDGSVSSS